MAMAEGCWIHCYKCKTPMWIPHELNEAALKARGDVAFYCAYGHKQFYVEGETEEQKLRRERDRLAQRIAEKDDDIRQERERREAVERQLSAQKGVVTRIKNRVGKGVCPCCNRTFENLQRHMHSKHPAYVESEAA